MQYRQCCDASAVTCGEFDCCKPSASCYDCLDAGCLVGPQGGNITQYNGNMLLAPLNCIQWTAEYGDSRSITVATTAPDQVLYNADMAAQAFLNHLQGTTLLSADALLKGEILLVIC